MGHNIITLDKSISELQKYSCIHLVSTENVCSDDIGTLCSNGDAVQQWQNPFNTSRVVRQTVLAWKPYYRTGGQNSKPYISYAATAAYLIAYNTHMGLGQQFTVTAVFDTTDVNINYIFKTLSSGLVCGFHDTGKYSWAWTGAGGTCYDSTQSGESGVQIVTWAWQNYSDNCLIYKNGSLVSGGTISNTRTNVYSGSGCIVGAGGTNLKIYEITVTPYILPASDIVTWHTYLNSIYAIY